MWYVNDVSINEAVIHILDNNSNSVVFNELELTLNDETYEYILKHLRKCLKSDSLKYAFFSSNNEKIKSLSESYFNGHKSLIEISKEFAQELFSIMKSNNGIHSCDVLVVSISTEFGPMLALLKMDYVKNYIHSIDVVDQDKTGISIIPQLVGLPQGGSKIQKCAFIKQTRNGNEFDLMVIDKQPNKSDEMYGSSYFLDFLGCYIVNNERDLTKNFSKTAEKWIEQNLRDNAPAAESIRSKIKNELNNEDTININKLSEEVLGENDEAKESFVSYMASQNIKNSIDIDKEWVIKKDKRKLVIDNDIEISISQDTYNDKSRFEVKKNEDGSLNFLIKKVKNYIEK